MYSAALFIGQSPGRRYLTVIAERKLATTPPAKWEPCKLGDIIRSEKKTLQRVSSESAIFPGGEKRARQHGVKITIANAWHPTEFSISITECLFIGKQHIPLHGTSVAMHVCPVQTVLKQYLWHESNFVTAGNTVVKVPIRRCGHPPIKTSEFFEHGIRNYYPAAPPRITARRNRATPWLPAIETIEMLAQGFAGIVNILSSAMSQAKLELIMNCRPAAPFFEAAIHHPRPEMPANLRSQSPRLDCEPRQRLGSADGPTGCSSRSEPTGQPFIVEPSSTTITSDADKVCANTLSIACPRKRAWL